MAITRTLRSNGGDYTHMSTWESTEQAGFEASPEPHTLECYSDWPTGLYDRLDFNWANTSATNHVTVKAAAGQDHGGSTTLGDGFYMRHNVGYQGPVRIRTPFVTVQGLQLKGEGDNSPAVEVVDNNVTISVDSCVLVGSTNASQFSCALRFASTLEDITEIRNSVMIDSYRGFAGTSTFRSVNIYNCHIINCTTTPLTDSPNATRTKISNSLAWGTGGSDPDWPDLSSVTSTMENNASEDTSAPGTNPVTAVTITDFVDEVSGDFSPAPGGKLDGAGTSPPIFSTDIAGATRNDPDDIGAYAVAGTGAVTVAPDDLSQSQTISEVTLTYTAPNYTVDPDDLSQDQTIDQVTLTYTEPDYAVDPDDLSQDQTIGPVTLTYTPPTGIIAPEAIDQQQSIAEVTLTYTPPLFTLDTADLSQSQTIDPVILTYTPPLGVIAPEAIYQQQTISEVTLTYTPPLVTIEPDDLTQTQYISTVRFGGLASGSMSGKVRVYPAIDGLTTTYH